MKSEFDKYLDFTYTRLGTMGHLCLNNSRFYKNVSMTDGISKLTSLEDKAKDMEDKHSDLVVLRNELNKIDHLYAKLELYLIWPSPELN